MRFSGLFALAAGALTLVLASSDSAQAFHRDRAHPPAGWHHAQSVRHWVYYPRYHHTYLANGATDPYAYRYQPNGYYPYYNSAYWKPAKCVKKRRAHLQHPPYYQAWGHSKKHYNHLKWHAKHYGGHRFDKW